MTLFDDAAAPHRPLADRLRPTSVDSVTGQRHLLAEGKPLRVMLDGGQLHSMILWGPPGVGKTTLARLLAARDGAEFLAVSAVLSGVREIRAAVERARQVRTEGRSAVLFVDEVHRFNKAQQDAFLPHIEDGTVVFVGATTENPSFELNNALLSRCRVYRLRSLEDADLAALLERILTEDPQWQQREIAADARQQLIRHADGDARRLLNFLDIAAELVDATPQRLLDDAVAHEVLTGEPRRFDKGGDIFYDQISALHKSVRGSDPDAGLYWLARMLDGGCDPLYVARRVVRMASEDIGNADPRGLDIALAAWDVVERLGSPEGELALAQAVTYLAVAAKSNAVYTAFNKARALAGSSASHEVPLHLRNAPTRLMKSEGHGAGYRYAHDEPHGYAAGETYLPEELIGTRFYEPVDRGMERRIREKLEFLRGLDAAAVGKEDDS